MGSFAGHAFEERGSGGSTFPLWTKQEQLVERVLPAGNGTALVGLGLEVERLALVVKVSATELAALFGDVLERGELIYSWETVDAFLESITDVQEVTAGNDTYFATLNVIRL